MGQDLIPIEFKRLPKHQPRWPHSPGALLLVDAQAGVIQQAIANLHAYLERKANEVAVLQRRLEGMDGLNHRQLALLRELNTVRASLAAGEDDARAALLAARARLDAMLCAVSCVDFSSVVCCFAFLCVFAPCPITEHPSLKKKRNKHQQHKKTKKAPPATP